MLNFSKTKIIFIYFLLIVLVFFASLNFVSRDSKLIDKNINLKARLYIDKIWKKNDKFYYKIKVKNLILVN